MSLRTLYRYEAKGIQAYILRTNKLKEIKGASLLVELLPTLLDRTLEGLGLDGTVEGAAAGGASVLFDTEDAARRLAEVWPLLVDRFAPGLQIVQAHVPVGADPDAAWEHLHRLLRSARNRPLASLPEVGPLVSRSPRSGLPAEPFDSRINELLDRGLRRARQFGDDTRGDTLGERIDPSLRWALDLDLDMGGSLIAVVHADGNDLGSRLRELEPERLGAFSETLSEVTALAVREAFAEVRERAGTGPGGRVPIRPIVIGGDDLTILLRADLAFDFTARYLERFRALSSEPTRAGALGGPMDACAGIAFVHTHHPFDAGAQLAEELCSFAKGALRGSEEGSTPAALAFHRVTTSLSGSWEEVLDGELSLDGRRLSASPYVLRPLPGFLSIDDLRVLRASLTGLPSSGVRDAIGLLLAAPQQAHDRIERLGRVLQDRGGRPADAWTAFASALEAARCDGSGWLERQEEKMNPLLDGWTLNVVRDRAEAGSRA